MLEEFLSKVSSTVIYRNSEDWIARAFVWERKERKRPRGPILPSETHSTFADLSWST